MCACEKQPEFPVPEQRVPIEIPKALSGRILNMDDPGVERYFVGDILTEPSSSWRWAFRHPAVKIRIRTDRPLKYIVDLAVPEITFRDTGPVTISFLVNNHVLDRVRYTTPGEHHFEKAIPPDWIVVGAENVAGAVIDKLWTAPGDGNQFGFILSRIGLAE